jgi:invasion protein IalB
MPAAFAAVMLILFIIAQFPAAAQQSASPANPSTVSQDLLVQPAHLIYSPWLKFCLKALEPSAKRVCFTGKDGQSEPGKPVVAVVLIEPEGDPKRILRVTLPLGMSIQPGTRVIVDNGEPMTGPYVSCSDKGCMADYEASDELIGKLKKGQMLVIQAINGAGQPISLVMPLADFAQAYDGPPTDPKVFEAQQKSLPRLWRDDRILPSFQEQKRLQDELLKRRHDEQPRFPRIGAVN